MFALTLGSRRRSFASYSGDELVLSNLTRLKTIERRAFYGFEGLLRFRGSFDALTSIGPAAFAARAGAAARSKLDNRSSVVFPSGLPNLQRIANDAFMDFPGKVVFDGAYPALTEVGPRAFAGAGNHLSALSFAGLPANGTSIGARALHAFRGAVRCVPTIGDSIVLLLLASQSALAQTSSASSRKIK